MENNFERISKLMAIIPTYSNLIHNTSYHTSVGWEPTRVFQGRIPYKPDHKLGLKNDPNFNMTTDFADEVLRRT